MRSSAARGQGAFSRAVLGSTSSSLVHHADRPVLVVPAGAGSLDGPALIGYDGSDGARAAITAAGRLLAGRRALVVHVWLSPARPMYAGPTSGEVRQAVVEAPTTGLYAVTASLARECADEGAELAQEAGLAARGLAVESAFSEPRALAATAGAEGASVIVAGCRGRGALRMDGARIGVLRTRPQRGAAGADRPRRRRVTLAAHSFTRNVDGTSIRGVGFGRWAILGSNQ